MHKDTEFYYKWNMCISFINAVLPVYEKNKFLPKWVGKNDAKSSIVKSMTFPVVKSITNVMKILRQLRKSHSRSL